MVNTRLQLINKLGLHARAASKFSSTCSRFSCKTQVTKDGKAVDGKSIMALMLLVVMAGRRRYFAEHTVVALHYFAFVLFLCILAVTLVQLAVAKRMGAYE